MSFFEGVFRLQQCARERYSGHSRCENIFHVGCRDAPDSDDGQRDAGIAAALHNRAVAFESEHGTQVAFGLREAERSEADVVGALPCPPFDVFEGVGIVNIEKNNKGEVLYTTKGDNNLTVDSKKVTNEQIIGIVKTVVHFIGYPTVWLNDVFSH